MNEKAKVNFNRMSKDAYDVNKAFHGVNRGMAPTNPPVNYGAGYTGVTKIDNINIQDLLNKNIITKMDRGGKYKEYY